MMKHKSLTAVLSLLATVCSLTAWSQTAGNRQRLDQWEFSLDSAHWQQVTVPHSYNAIDGHSKKYYRGKGFYRLTLPLSKTDVQRPLQLLLEGAAQQATVYVNNHRLTHHMGGYTPFWVRLNGVVHEGDNSVVIVCDNHEDVNLIPVNSDFNKNGGLHNPVYLLKMSDVYFSPEHTGLYRLHVATPRVTDEAATACFKADVVNATKRRQRITVDFQLQDANGRTVYAQTRHYDLRPQTTAAPLTVTDSCTIARPHLWQGVADPYRYNAVVTMRDRKGQLLDRVSTKIGFRYFQATADRGFFLNGKPYPLRGVSEHQDMDLRASAVTDSDILRDYQTIQELGCNFLRLAHYPHRDLEYQLCDSLGIIVQTEIPWVDVCGVRAQPLYFDAIHSQMREMITSLYNHPSIVFWGMWNELDNWGNNDKLQGKLDCARVVAETARLYDYAKQLDSGRLVGMTDCTCYGREGYTKLKGDFFSENRYNGWYYNHDNPANIRKEMEDVRQKMGVCNISEYGAGCNPFCHTTMTDMKQMRADDKYHYEEFANLVHEEHVRQIHQMPFLNFTSMWILFDFPVAARHEGFMDSDDGIHFTENDNRKYMNDKGLVTRDRKTKKDAFYLYKAWWNHKVTTVYITGRRLTRLPAGQPYIIKVYSNAKRLSLYVDGQLQQTLDRCDDPSGIIWTFNPITLPAGHHVFRVTGDGAEDSVEKTGL